MARSTWVFWSTNESVKAGITSVMAITETFVAVAVFAWLAGNYNFFRPMVLSAAVIAPLVLLRSPASQATAVRWFIAFEQRIAAILSPENKIRGVHFDLIFDSVGLISFLIFIFCLPHLPHHLPLASSEPEDVRSYSETLMKIFAAVFVVWAIILNTASHFILARRVGEKISKFGKKFLAVRASVVVILMSLIYLISLSYQKVYVIFSIASASIFLTSLFGPPLVVLIASSIIRGTANIINVRDGISCIPQNFRRLVLCTCPKQIPEIVPGIMKYTDRFSLLSLFSRYLKKPYGDWLDLFSGRKLYGFILFLWFGSAWLYRIALKSTAWLWWPLAILSSPPNLAKNPDWFHEKLTQTKWARDTKLIAYLSVVMFLGTTIWHGVVSTEWVANPYLSIVGYAFVIEIDTTPWQIMGFFGSIITIYIAYWIDIVFRKYEVARNTGDFNLKKHALSHFPWIERLVRLRVLMFATYCAIVGFHAFLFLNSRACWFIPKPPLQALAITLYGEYSPNLKCEGMLRN